MYFPPSPNTLIDKKDFSDFFYLFISANLVCPG